MKQRIILSIIVLLLTLGGWFSYDSSTSNLYDEYKKISDYRRMHPETLPQVESTRLFIAGHDTIYADSLWISLIQYIGDNIFNGKAREFTNPLVDRITTLHPHFPKPYNIALILTPTMKDEKRDPEKDKAIILDAIRLGERGIEKNCDAEKISRIRSMSYSSALWEDATLADPCRDDMLAYNLAYLYSDIRDSKNAKLAYMISSTQKEGPQASRFLAVLSDAKEGDHLKAAESFLLTALSGYDEDPFICQKKGSLLLMNLTKGEQVSSLVKLGEDAVRSIKETEDKANPLAQSSTNCYSSLRRAIKQIYLAYITEEASKSPDATTSEELQKAGILTTYPTLPEQTGYTLVKKNSIWSYQFGLPKN